MSLIDEVVVTGTRIEDRSQSCGCGSSAGDCECGSAGLGVEVGVERPIYFPRQIVGPDDLNQGQLYLAERLRRHNRFLHGWGIACGLRVEWCGPDDEGNPTCRVRVTSGYALDAYGDEIYVPSDQIVDLCKEVPSGGLACVPNDDPWCSPVDILPNPEGMWLAIRHIEVPVKPVRAPTGCSCDEAHCEHSRMRDWYEFTLLPDLPSHFDWPCSTPASYCRDIRECPPCPESGWIVLAQVRVSGSAVEHVDSDSGRRYLVSLATACSPCGPNEHERAGLVYSPHRAVAYLASVSDSPDTSALLNYATADGELYTAAVAVRAADIEGRTGSEINALFEGATFLDVVSGQPVLAAEGIPLTAAIILAHSPLRGDSIIDSVADLSVRVGTPTIDVERYATTIAEVRTLIDNNGLEDFEARSLNDVRELGALDVEALDGVSKANATKLRKFGINTLADLRTADKLPSDLTKPADAAATAMRELLRRNG